MAKKTASRKKKKAARKTSKSATRKKAKRQRASGRQVGGPYLISALLCEKILVDKEGVSTVIRVVDRFFVAKPNTLPAELRGHVAVNAFLYVNFKSGDFTGTKKVRIRTVTPSGEELPELAKPAIFKGGGSGVSLHVELRIGIKESGVHWIEVYLDDTLYTKTPMDISFATLDTAGTSSGT